MSRAKRIEGAARALLGELGPERSGVEWRVASTVIGRNALDALRSALALPEEESEVGFIVRLVGDPYVTGPLYQTEQEAVSEKENLECSHPADIEVWEIVRVRITVEGEEGEP